MKKETKKKLINSTILTAITATAVSPIAIALNKTFVQNKVNSEKTLSRSSITNSGYTLDSDFRVTLPSTAAYAYTPNSFKSIPGGYVFTDRSAGNDIQCVDENDPSKLKWKVDTPNDLKVLSIEYLPGLDRIAVLMGKGGQIKIGIIDNVSNASGEITFVAEPTTITTNTYRGYETFGMSPVFKANSSAEEVIIYSKLHWRGSDTQAREIHVYNVKNNILSFKQSVKYHFTDKEQAILGAGCFDNNGVYSLVLVMARLGSSSSTYTEGEYITFNRSNSWNKGYKNFFSSPDSDLMTQAILKDMIAGTISSPGVWYGGDGNEIVFSFAINNHQPKLGYSVHRAPLLLRVVVDPTYGNEQFWSVSVNHLFENNSSYTNTSELWNGYFDNAAPLKHGAIFTNGKLGTPFVGIGWKTPSNVASNSNGFFVTVIKDSTKNYGSMHLINSTDSPDYRMYPISSRNLVPTSHERAYLTNQVDIENENSSTFYAQQAPGFSILKYNDTGIRLTDPFNSDADILLLANNSNKATVINQSNRGNAATNEATYGYYTRITGTTTINANEPEMRIDNVDANYLISKYDIENTNSIFKNTIGLKNDVKGSQLTLKPNSIIYDNNNGSLTVELYSTKLFSSVGHLFDTTLTRLKDIFWTNHRLTTLTFTGFKPVKQTTAYSRKTLEGVNSTGQSASWVIPFYANTSNNDSNKIIKDIVWRHVCGSAPTPSGTSKYSQIFQNLKIQPVYNESTWERDFDNFFSRFNITAHDNLEGTITVNLNVNSNFISGNSNLNQWSIVFSGLRKLKLTSVKSNTSNTAISVAGTELASKNIPYQNSSSYPSITSYDSEVKVVSEQEIKQFIYEKMVLPAYEPENFNSSSGWNPHSEFFDGLAFATRYINQTGLDPNSLLEKKLSVNNILLSNWEFYPVNGTLSVEVGFNIFNSNNYDNGNGGLSWTKSATLDDITGTEPDSNAPRSRIYFTGFSTKNTVTVVDEMSTWDLSEFVSDISITQIFEPSNRTLVEKALLSIGLRKGYIKPPFWVNKNYYLQQQEREALYDIVSTNISTGEGVLSVGFRTIGWFAEENGTVIQRNPGGMNGTPQWDEWTWNVKVTGFKPISPILVDSAKFFEISNTLQDPVYMKPITTNAEFRNWLTRTQENITNYVWEQDKAINGAGSVSLEDWKKRLSFRYTIETASSSQSFGINDLQSGIKDFIFSKKGKLGYLYNDNTLDGIKIWLTVTDNSEGYNSSIQGSSSNNKLGQNLSGVINTTKIIIDRDLRDWFNAMEANKGTNVEGYDENTGSIKSIIPPFFEDSNSPAGGMTFDEVISYLERIGYTLNFKWTDKTGVEKTSSSLPKNFTIDQSSPYVYLEISYDKNLIIPPNYIFGDSTYTQTKHTIQLSLAIKQIINVTLSPFKAMNSNEFFANTNILINSDGSYDSQTVIQVRDKWKEFENSFWNSITSDPETIELYKSLLDIKYSINSSSFNYTYQTMWDPIGESWRSSISPKNDMSKLRFYSDNFKNGLKIGVTIQFKNPDLANQSYKLKFQNDESDVIVNHGMGTTFDFGKMAKFFESNKAIAGEGSTADQLNGFTPASYEGVAFPDLVKKLESIGVVFQYSGNKTDWVETREEVTQVDQANPVVYMRMYSKISDQISWSNEFEIKNFATGVTQSTSEDPNLKYSSGVELSLNLPKFLRLETSWIKEFIDRSKSAWSGNTKNIVINHKTMLSEIDKLKSKIISENNVSGSLTTTDLKVEFKIDAASATSSSGSTFAEYNQSLASNIASGNYWEQFANGVFVRVVLATPDNPNISYDEIQTSYNNADQEFALAVIPHSYFVDNANTNNFNQAVNPIKVWKASVEEKLPTIRVEGTTNKNIQFVYPLGFVYDEGQNKVYTDSSKRLIVQFSTKNVTSYDDPNAEWSDTPPREISVEKLLFVRVIPNYNNVVYGPVEDSTARFHKLDTSNIKPVIEANIDLLRELMLTGTILIGGTNQNKFNLEELKALEQQVLLKVVLDEFSRSNVEIVYSLRVSSTDKNTNWMTLDQLIKKLNDRNWLDQSFGIISFEDGKYSLQATIRSKNPEYNVIDLVTGTQEKVAEGIKLITSEIQTHIDLTEWVETITSNKASLVKKVRKNSRAIVDIGAQGKIIQPVSMAGELGTSFLSGRSYSEIYNILLSFGISFQFSSDNRTWTASAIEELTWFDDKTNKIYMRIIGERSQTNQVRVVIENEIIQIKSVTIPIQYPKSLIVEEEWINQYIKSKPVSGNTKFLQVNEELESAFVQKILDANPPTLGDPIPVVWVEYSLGSSGWLKREEFIKKLAETNSDQTTNEIKFRLAVDPVNPKEPVYAIDNTEYVLSSKNIGTLTTEIKIYVNQSYESDANTVSITGSNEIFTYNYGRLPVESSNGTWNGANGLKIQWTINSSATYADPVDSPNWSDSQISEINPTERYLAIRIIEQVGYVYSASYNGNGVVANADIHVVDTTNIKSLIKVDLNNLYRNLVFQGYSNNLDLKALKASEQSILESIENGDKLGIRYKVTLDNGTQLPTEWLTSDELQQTLLTYSKDYANSTSGLIKFTSDEIPGATIQATFVSIDDNYVPVDPSNNVETGINANTENIKLKIDLSKYFEVLRTVTTNLGQGSTSSDIKGITPPSMTGSKGESLFAGFTFNEIKQVLLSLGVKIEFQAPGSSTANQWLPAEQIRDLNNLNELLIRFVPINESQYDNIEIWGKNGLQNNTSPETVQLVIQLPITITVNIEELSRISFKGNTNNLTNLETIKRLEQEIITETKNNNKTGNPATDDKIDAADMIIVYSLNELQLSEPTSASDGIWFTVDEISKIFATSKVNYGTNRVLAKFKIINNPILEDGVTPTYQLSTEEPKVINEEQLTNEAPFKVYIHNVQETTPTWIFDNLKVIGTVENYSITNLDSWIKSLPKGLKVQYNVTKDANSVEGNPTPDISRWFDEFNAENNKLSPDKDIWIRFVVQPGFIFENAIANSNVSNPIKLDATKVKQNIKLKSEWLNSISLSGNTKNIEIDEARTRAFIDKEAELPSTLDRAIVKIEYTFNGVDWYEKDAFKAKLIEQDGAVDEINWIILRENIKARFVINKTINDQQNPPFGFEVDGLIIEEGQEEKSPQIQLITETNNANVKGYINANKLTPFIASNFEVNGTNTSSSLIIRNVATFNKLLNPYASSGVLKILYSEDEAKGFLPDQVVWDPAYGMKEKIKIVGEHSDLYFAVALQAANPNYDVYHDNALQTPNGYVLSSPDIKVYISIEIENPLIGKDVQTLFLNDENKPIWYQNEGAFHVKIKTNDGIFTFEDFINSIPEGTGSGQLTAGAKEAIELVYYVSDHALTEEEYEQAIAEEKILDYAAANASKDKYNVWRSLKSSADLASLNFSLLVNDYVIVALRVKEQYISSETNKQGYVIKDGNYTPTIATRVFGYKIHADQVNVNWSSLKLKNVDKAESAEYGLDGYAMLNSLSLSPDVNNNYQGVSLELKFFNEFHRNNSGDILVSASGDRLVKRDTTGLTSDTPYLDINGEPIVDSTGQTVYNYLTKEGIPPAPIKEASSTRAIMLAEKSNNNFTLVNADISKNADYSFFANQYIEIEFKNKKGLSPENQDIYDYYVDQQVSRSYTINKDGNNLIKFPITNDKHITYTFNATEFIEFISKDSNISEGLVYDNPINGEAKLIHSYEITRTAKGENVKVLKTFNEIIEQIKNDFNGQVVLRVTYIKKSTGETTTLDEVELSKFSNLSNGDIFKVEILSSNDELIYGEQPDPLVFEISGLKVKSFDQSLLQFLRVEQSGEWNGEGQFRLYIDNPNDTSDDGKTIKELLNNEGEFLVRVWDKDRQIKHNWTPDFDSIQNLENGDKVEWRLVRNNERPEQEYYNTIATSHTQEGFEFSVVQFDGNYSVSLVSKGIGEWNGQDEYPENSGFIINNLKDNENVDFPGITFEEFERLIKLLDFKYKGINGYGNIVSSKNASDIIVNTKELTPTAKSQYSLEYLISKGYIKFYSSNGEGKADSLDYNEFNWIQVRDENGQFINSPGYLWNGQWIKITYQDDTMSQPWEISGDTFSSLIVNGLATDPSEGEPISMITWVLLSIAGVATLGIFFFIYFFARNKKLK